MHKLLKKLINELEKFDSLSEEVQINKLKKLKRLFPGLTVLIRNEEIK